MTDERELLLAMLDGQRRHVMKTMADLPEAVMLQQVLPSRWSPAGLIHHLAHDVERFWFRQVMLDEPGAIVTPVGSEAWDVPEGMTAAEILAEYQTEIAYNNEVVRGLALDAAPRWWDMALFGHAGPETLHEILLHVMVETATHAGHMDVVRELYDGHQNLVFTDESRPGR